VAPPSSAAASVAPLDTFDERRMSFGGEDIADVRLSPDGQTIAYSAYEPGSDVVLFTRSIRGGEAVRVPLPAAAAKPRSQSLAGYLPDGSLALLLDTAENPWTFWGVGIDGATRIVGQLRRACEWAHVSPDGTRALVMRDDGLYVESITSDVSVRLTSSGSGAQAEWSPSGDSVVYGAVDFRNVAAVDITSADGRRTHHVSDDPLIRNSVGGAALGWPEPHRLLMVVRRGTGSALVEIALDANDEPAAPPRDVYVWPDAQVQRLSSEKKNVAFIKIQVRREIYTAPLAPGLGALAVPLVPLTSDDADDTPVGWLDDHRLAFTSNREGRFALYARTTPAGSTDAVSRDVEGARVMSTGELVAWKGRRVDAGEPCALVRIDGGGEHEVFRALAADDATIACNTTLRCVRVASGSRCIALESTRDSSVWSPVDLETGKKGEPIFRSREVARNWDLSPSADTIVFTVEGTKTVNYVSIASKVLRQVRMTPEFNPQYVSYSPDGRRLVLTGMRDSGDAYVAASSDLEGHTRILATTRDAWFSAPALSPDGQQLAVAELHFPSFLGLLAPR
jgi:Tol biopolymer transport system component